LDPSGTHYAVKAEVYSRYLKQWFTGVVLVRRGADRAEWDSSIESLVAKMEEHVPKISFKKCGKSV
jgi:hypothetical protein